MSSAAALPVNVFEGQDFYVPSYLVKVQNRELRQEVNDILSVSYTDSLSDVDSFTLKVNNWNGAAPVFDQTAFKYSDANTFNPWQDVEVWMGYMREGRDERRRMLIGEITSLVPDFPQSGPSTLTVRGLNLFHRFRTEQVTRPFFAEKDTAVAERLIADIAESIRKRSPGLRLLLDPEDANRNKAREQPIPYLLVNNQYPIVFLMERARRIGYELAIEEKPGGAGREVVFHYRPTSDVKRTTYVLEWGKSLLSFKPKLQVANQVAEVTVRGWSPRKKDKIEYTARRSDVAAEGIVSPADLAVIEPSLAQKREVVSDRPIQSDAEAKELAIKILRQVGQSLVEASGKTIGVPDLRAGVKVEIRGLGTRFSGTYVVTGTTHTIGEGGYTTDFTARMEKP
jgi:hypothetical protein